MSVCDTDAHRSQNNHPKPLALELTCPICLELFTDPVSLPCGHVYCFVCLQTMGEGLDQHSCPECQAEYHGTESLVKSIKMCDIIETYKASVGKVKSSADCSDQNHTILDSSDKVVAEGPNLNYQHCNIPTADGGLEESSDCKGKENFQSESGSEDHEQSKKEMEEKKFRLASMVTELSLKLEKAEGVLKKEEDQKREVTTANDQLRERADKLLGQIKDLSQSYSAQVMQLIEEQLSPGETSLGGRVAEASELTEQLRQAKLRAQLLLMEDNETEFSKAIQTLQAHIVELMAKPVNEEEGHIETKINSGQACSKLDQMNAELREQVGDVQRTLRNTLNPSEVTFDPETAHPNLVLSEDLKTVTFSASKRTFPFSPQRFTSFFQVLSSQSFCEGDHCWQVELEGSPWIIGVCYSEKLPRAGMSSALESSQSSWCLMWFNNLLTAFEQSKGVPLKRTTVSCRLEIRLSFTTHTLSFYNISPISGKTHVYTFKANLTEPVHLAYRMMSGHSKGRVTVCS
ncbi:uncharacterized protein V6R79_003055 [Siganus canaliculatus]